MNIELKILNKEFYSYDSGLVDSSNLGYELPFYATAGSAALDLVCTENVAVFAGETCKIRTGLALWLGSHTDKAMKAYRQHWDYVGLIVPRSGLGSSGLVLANTIGVIDSDYQGEILVNVWNRLDTGGYDKYNNKIDILAGDRFAQLMILPVARAAWNVVEEFSNITDRSTGGFGSTG